MRVAWKCHSREAGQRLTFPLLCKQHIYNAWNMVLDSFLVNDLMLLTPRHTAYHNTYPLPTGSPQTAFYIDISCQDSIHSLFCWQCNQRERKHIYMRKAYKWDRFRSRKMVSNVWKLHAERYSVVHSQYYILYVLWWVGPYPNSTSIFTSVLNVLVPIYDALVIYIENGLPYHTMFYIYSAVQTLHTEKLIETSLFNYCSGFYHFISPEWFHLYLGGYRAHFVPW